MSRQMFQRRALRFIVSAQLQLTFIISERNSRVMPDCSSPQAVSDTDTNMARNPKKYRRTPVPWYGFQGFISLVSCTAIY
eukprot:2250027-Rhodomonas_salina.1